MAFSVVSVSLGQHTAVVAIAVGCTVHQLAVTRGGAVLTPEALSGHPLRQDIEGEVRQVAAAAWVGKASAAGDV